MGFQTILGVSVII